MDMMALIEKAKNGDKDAQSSLYEANYKKVYYLALRITKKPEDAEDAAQEAFIAAFKALPKLENNNAFQGWLFQIVANKCRNKLTRTKQADALPEGFEEHTPDTSEGFLPEDILQDAEKRRLIMAIVDTLPDAQRECVMLFYYSEMSVKQIAATFEISEGTVKSRLNYARQKIKDGILETEERDNIRLHTLVPFGLLLAKDLEVVTANMTIGVLEGVGVVGGVATAVGATSETAKAGLLATIKAKIIAGVTAAAVAVGGGVAIAQMPKTIEFTDPIMEQNVRVLIEKPEGKITEEDVAVIFGLYLYDDGVNMDGPNEHWNDEPKSGTTAMVSLSDLHMLPNLTNVYNDSADPEIVTTMGFNENILHLTTVSWDNGTALSDVRFIEDLPSLERLQVVVTAGTDISPIEQHENLWELSIGSYGDMAINCDQLVNLLWLYVGIEYSEGSPDGKLDIELTNTLPNLMRLDASGQLQDLDFLAYTPTVQLLDISSENLSSLDLQHLAGLSQLKAIFLDGAYDSTLDLAPLSNCPQLEVYYISNGNAINLPPQAVTDTQSHMPFYNDISGRIQDDIYNLAYPEHFE